MDKYGGYSDNPVLAELYDLVPLYQQRSDINFYLNIGTEQVGEILELGCGSGRILIPIVNVGGRITGLDISPHMLERCREKLAQTSVNISKHIELIEGDITNFDLGIKFDLITIPFRVLQHLKTHQEVLSCFQCVKDHLTDIGRLIFDVFQLNLEFLEKARPGQEIENFAEINLTDGRRLKRNHRIVSLHPEEQYNVVELIYYLADTAGKIERISQKFEFRYFFKDEMYELLEKSGLEVVELYGDFDRSPHHDKAPEMIFVAQKRLND